jgi:hypothetical protein
MSGAESAVLVLLTFLVGASIGVLIGRDDGRLVERWEWYRKLVKCGLGHWRCNENGGTVFVLDDQKVVSHGQGDGV